MIDAVNMTVLLFEWSEPVRGKPEEILPRVKSSSRLVPSQCTGRTDRLQSDFLRVYVDSPVKLPDHEGFLFGQGIVKMQPFNRSCHFLLQAP
jgi:hypothetical protein